MAKSLTYSLAEKIHIWFFGEPNVSKEQLAELDAIKDPKARMQWYMENMYDRREVGFFRTHRPLRSPRMAAMLADPSVAPIVRKALHDADRKAVRDANLAPAA